MKQHTILFLVALVAVSSLTFVSYVNYKYRNTFRYDVFLSPIKTSKDPNFPKSFVYLTETESCLPQNLATPLEDASTCNCDVIVLSFRTPCVKNAEAPQHISYLLDPKSTWISGRNTLFFAALDRRPGYQYYIFVNDDTVVQFNKFTPPEMAATRQPFRAVEKWLLDYEPAVGVLDYPNHNGARVHFNRRRNLCGITKTSLAVPVVIFDAVLNAFHYKAVTHLLPYRAELEYNSWFLGNMHVMSGAEIKFRGQVLLFAAATALNPRHRPYPKWTDSVSPLGRIEVWRDWIKDSRRLAPSEYRNNTLFDKLLFHPQEYGSITTTLCMNATKHQAIVPYAHFRSA